MVAAAAVQIVLLYLPGTDDDLPRRVRRRTLAMLLCVALFVVIFVRTPARYSLADPYVRSGAYYEATPTPAAAPYVLIYIGYVAWVGVQGTILSLRFARGTTRTLLRLGLRLAAVGALLGVAYLAVKVIASIAATRARRRADRRRCLIPPLYTTSTVTLLIGATIPSWGERIGLDRAWANLTARWDCRRLQPLWDLVCRAVPEVALLPHPTQPTLRRVRMIVEILDGYVRLAPWMSEAAVQRVRAAPTGRDDADAATEAELLIIAALDKLAGRPPAGDRAVSLPPASPLRSDGETDAVAQVAWLIRVARAVRPIEEAHARHIMTI